MIINDLYSLTIPEGAVKSIQLNGSPVWTRPMIYGVSWNKKNTSKMTRTDDSALFTEPTIGTGTTKGSSPFDDCYPWNKMEVVNNNGNELVSIPKFWYKWTDTSNALTLQISNKSVEGFQVSPMHADRGDGKGEREVAYIGRYKCNTSYKSQSNYAPVVSITRATARSKIAALGTGYYQHDYASFWTIRMLFLVEFANWNSQSILQNTTNYSSVADIKTGNTTSMAYHTGVSANGHSIAYRYIEDPWENVLEWVDGIYFSSGNVYCINTPAKFSDSANGKKICTKPTTTGHIKSWTIPTTNGFQWALFPATTNGETAGYINDYYYPQSGAVLYTGGSRTSGVNHGAFMMYGDFSATGTSAYITTRLMYLPS